MIVTGNKVLFACLVYVDNLGSYAACTSAEYSHDRRNSIEDTSPQRTLTQAWPLLLTLLYVFIVTPLLNFLRHLFQASASLADTRRIDVDSVFDNKSEHVSSLEGSIVTL